MRRSPKFKLKIPRRDDGGAGNTVVRLLVIFALLVLPFMALQRRGVDFRWVAAYGFLWNALTYWMYAIDKRRAEGGEWRVPETRLHLLEMLGGWPGAFLAQRRLRHKCSKGSYQFTFWLIVLVYQFVAFDSLQNWKFSRAAVNLIQPASEQQR